MFPYVVNIAHTDRAKPIERHIEIAYLVYYYYRAINEQCLSRHL